MNTKSRTNNVIKNVSFGLGCRFIDIIFNFFIRILFVKILGEEILGVNGLFTNILTWLSLADLGFGTAMSYSFYKPLAEKNEKKLAALTRFYRNVYGIIMVVIVAVGLLLIPFLDIFINTSSEIPYITSYYIILLLNTAASYLFVYKSAILRADQNEYIISTCSTCFNVLKAIVQIIVLLFYKNYQIFLIIQVIFTIFHNLVISKIADQKYPFLKEKEELQKLEKKKIYSNVLSVLLYKISGTLLNGTDNILISMIIGTVFVGYYSNYLLVINSISVFVSIVFSSVYGSLGSLLNEKNKMKNEQSFNLLIYLGYFIATVTSACILSGLTDFISIFFGNKYVLDYLTLIAIILNYYLSCICHPIWTFRETTGLFGKVKFIMLIAAAINLILSIIFGYWCGIFGIIIASVISRIVTYFWYEPLLLYKDFFQSTLKIYFKKIVKYFILSLIAIVPSVVLSFITKESICFLIIKLILAGGSSLVLFIFTTRNDENLLKLFSILKSKIKKVRKEEEND